MRFRSDPAAIRGSIDYWDAGKLEAAQRIHYGLIPVTDVIFTETNPAAATWVPAQAGLIGSGFVRPPLVPLTEPGRDRVRALLRQGLAVLDGPVAVVAEARVRSGE
jgi:4-hydroxy-tetrahydrodipicolinate synthase